MRLMISSLIMAGFLMACGDKEEDSAVEVEEVTEETEEESEAEDTAEEESEESSEESGE